MPYRSLAGCVTLQNLHQDDAAYSTVHSTTTLISLSVIDILSQLSIGLGLFCSTTLMTGALCNSTTWRHWISPSSFFLACAAFPFIAYSLWCTLLHLYCLYYTFYSTVDSVFIQEKYDKFLQVCSGHVIPAGYNSAHARALYYYCTYCTIK
jgi:hypothetical protein